VSEFVTYAAYVCLGVFLAFLLIRSGE